MSVSTRPDSERSPLETVLTDALANAVLTSSVRRSPKRWNTDTGTVSSLMREKASPEPMEYVSNTTPLRAVVPRPAPRPWAAAGAAPIRRRKSARLTGAAGR